MFDVKTMPARSSVEICLTWTGRESMVSAAAHQRRPSQDHTHRHRLQTWHFASIRSTMPQRRFPFDTIRQWQIGIGLDGPLPDKGKGRASRRTAAVRPMLEAIDSVSSSRLPSLV